MKTPLLIDNFNVSIKDQLRIVTINVLNNPDRLTSRYEALVKELADEEIDVLCLQEVIFDAHTREPLNLDILCDGLGLQFSSSLIEAYKTKQQIAFGNAILTKAPAVSIDINSTFSAQGDAVQQSTSVPFCTAIILQHNGREIYVITGHFAWGGENEHLRLQQFHAINKYADNIRTLNPDAIIVLTGDFNCLPESASVRYLSGLDLGPDGRGAFWVDSWKMHGEKKDGITSSTAGYWAKKTAMDGGIVMPSLVPSRRIDYILVHGWVYGRPGSPLTIERVGHGITEDNLPISDHFGLMTDLWVPSSELKSLNHSSIISI